MDDPTSYNDSNRAFVQAFLARGTLTYTISQPILAAIFTVHEGREILPNDITEADFRSYVSAANLALSPLDLEIRSTFHQRSRERVYALINTSSDALTQMATTYSVEEMGFVKRVLDWMFEGPGNTRRSEAMCISATEAVNLAKASGGRRETQNGNLQGGGSSQGLSMREAEGMMGRLVEEDWFEKSGKGFYSLSPRALMELRGWLVESYNDLEEERYDDGVGSKIKFCQACKEIVTVVSPDAMAEYKETRQRIYSDTATSRVNDVQSENVLVGYTISVPQTSFVCSEIEIAPSVRQSGMASTSLVRKQSRPPRNTFREREEVAVAEEHIKRPSKRQMGMKKTECTIQVEISAQVQRHQQRGSCHSMSH
jgi:non-structural maintenance of chromosomes element 1